MHPIFLALMLTRFRIPIMDRPKQKPRDANERAFYTM